MIAHPGPILRSARAVRVAIQIGEEIERVSLLTHWENAWCAKETV